MDIAKASKAINSKNFDEIHEGNISVRIPGVNEFFITPLNNNYDYECMNPNDAVQMTFQGTILSASEGKIPSKEWRLHAEIYKARTKAMCVIHTHSLYATLMAVMHQNIPVILEEMVIFLGGEIQVSEMGSTDSFDLSEKTLKALKNNNGAIIANHGQIVCARTIDKAIKAAKLLEKIAFLYYNANLRHEINIINQDNVNFFRQLFDREHSTIPSNLWVEDIQ
jgi:ribulose-5-phosphate 4-epimerase/fuculose-1-phosphate aldolase